VLDQLGNLLKRFGPGAGRPVISTVILSWNRRNLLRKTIESYLDTISVPFELFVVDNASTDGAAEYIQTMAGRDRRLKAIYMNENRGGEAFNIGLEQTRGEFIHVSENDIEYLPSWDTALLSKFAAFPELGQLSPFSPFPQKEKGEIWELHPATPLTKAGQTIFVAEQNIATTCLVRREVFDRGVRWHTHKLVESNSFRFPDDGTASGEIRQLGYVVAWNDEYVVFNWGHNIEEFLKYPDYYISNYLAKSWMRFDGFKSRLNAHGYDLIETEQGYSILRLEND
jgi:glycosyltransferase involved in cell wall biosynthesis